MNDQAANTARDIIGRLEAAWNAADGHAFAAPFTADADFVNIRGDYLRSREAIAQGHHAIFTTIYQGSTVHYELLQARLLTDDVMLVHVGAALHVPTGPMAGELRSVAMLVLARTDGGWQIAAFHNTLVAPRQ